MCAWSPCISVRLWQKGALEGNCKAGRGKGDLLLSVWTLFASHHPSNVSSQQQVLFLARLESSLQFLWLSRYSRPSIPAGDWFQDPSWIPKCKDAQVPSIKWHSSVGPVYLGVLHPRIWRANCTTPWSHTSEKPALLASWHPLLEVCMPAPQGPSSRNPAPAQQLPRRDLSSNPSMNFSVLICLFALFPNLRTALLVLVPSMIP